MTTFSKYSWDLYRQSADGKSACNMKLVQFCSELQKIDESEAFLNEFVGIEGELPAMNLGSRTAEAHLLNWLELNEESESPHEQFTKLVDDGFSFFIKFNEPDFKGTQEFCFNRGPKPDFPLVYSNIHWISAGFHLAYPDQFAPFFFGRKFDLFTKICRRYGIRIPELPRKLKKRERAIYYLAINDELQKFRKASGLSPDEFNAFLYDYAIKDCGHDEMPETELPPPTRVWFVIGGTGGHWDHQYVEDADEDTVGIWQGNIDTRPGDIVVMYMASPKKAIHSIWRAKSYGFIDPFFYYYSAMRVGNPVKIPEIPFSEIAAHPTFKDTPAIRARFQGRSGSELTIKEYDAICEMAQKKGFDIKRLPVAPKPIELPRVEVKNERDVELKLLEPLLDKLGFDLEEWERQVSLKVGRRERVIPDYVLLPTRSGKQVSAKAMIEAKHNIVSEKDRNDAFDQARSYSKLLGVSRMGVVAKQGIWIFMTSDGNFDRARGEAFSWSDIEQPERFARLMDLIGKDSLEKL